jgi:hypothetical protein
MTFTSIVSSAGGGGRLTFASATIARAWARMTADAIAGRSQRGCKGAALANVIG